MLNLVARGCAVSHKKIIYQCYVPIFMVLKTINYFQLASDSVINYLTTRDENFTTKNLGVLQVYRYNNFDMTQEQVNSFHAEDNWVNLKIFRSTSFPCALRSSIQ